MNHQLPQERRDAQVPREAARPKHDLGQKRLFSHRRMVADLLRLLPDDLTRGLDLGTLRRLPAEHVGDALRGRRSDMPWRIDFLPSAQLPTAGKGAKQLDDEGTSAKGAAAPAPASSPAPALQHPGTCLVLTEFQSTVRSSDGGEDAGVRRHAAQRFGP